VLAKYYWLGISRAKPGAQYTYVDGSAVPNTVTTGKPYAHWSWMQPRYMQATQYNCVLAWQDLAYDTFTAPVVNATSAANIRSYNTDPRCAAGRAADSKLSGGQHWACYL
jgi:tripartite-type tricarboxylate transporter receptor subunit TctC